MFYFIIYFFKTEIKHIIIRMNKLIVSIATICMVFGVCFGLRGTPIFPKYKGLKVKNDYHYKEMWYPQTVS